MYQIILVGPINQNKSYQLQEEKKKVQFCPIELKVVAISLSVINLILGAYMEISSFRNIADFGMDIDPLFFQQWHVDHQIDDFASISSAFSEGFHQSYTAHQPLLDFKRPASPSPSPSPSPAGEDRPLKQLKTTNWNSCKPEKITDIPLPRSYSNIGVVKPKEETWYPSTTTITFPAESTISQSSNCVLKPCQGIKRISPNNKISQAQDHILAERKRREKLSQRFIALSALVPGLKKMDKASVLGDAIKYMKQLQEKVKNLEEKAKKTTVESVVFVKKYEVYGDGENSTTTDQSFSSGATAVSETTSSLPEIEARFCDKDVLISIHCEKRKGVLERIVAEIEKLSLSVVNSSVMTFGDSALNITIIAQKDEEFSVNMKELVKNLRGALKI
ncbi:basic helix-loop-helix DNA-binding superfamily protein [Perilla frutescens var. hirtella]|uniref:Basic helix-loop-helix DNA-binding superfamily protein n=1 Tax=Perilla frutescens var. hirtella TaxID=608512 RepID=A0AAD4PAI9_PERFH|nr:basic helix-loop-helix DNA-binding superfamily protein [Perilla frutescens var. hirtella]